MKWPQDFFQRKEWINENLNTWFFSGIWAENCSEFGEFFLAICQKAIYDCRGAFRGNGKVWDKFWQFWHEFVAWVSILLFNCPLEPLKKNIPQKIYILSLFNEHQTFQFFGETSFRQGCQSCNLRDRRRFLMKWFFFEETLCLYNFLQSLSGRNLDFCQFFQQRCQNCILRAQRNIPWKNLFFQNNIFNIVFGFWATKIEFWETIQHVLKNCLLRIQRNIWS